MCLRRDGVCKNLQFLQFKILMMRVVRIFFLVIIFSLLAVAGYVAYVKWTMPDIALEKNIKIPSDSVSIANGRYLANSIAVCMDCHSERDWTKLTGPLVSGTEGQGGERFDENEGFPGRFFSKNITPAGIGNWSDAEIYRAVVSGVDKDGKALFPVMPYLHYGQCDPQDIFDIIAYIKTLKPIKHETASSVPAFPVSILINTMPQKPKFSKRPDESSKIDFGKYLVTMAGCAECHTKQEKGKPLPGMDFAGGFEFKMPTGGIVSSVNITPDMETGIGKLTEDEFVSFFKQFSKDSGYVAPKVEKGKLNTPMPWTMYGNMKAEDLKAIYAYLRTVKPINHKVVLFKPE